MTRFLLLPLFAIALHLPGIRFAHAQESYPPTGAFALRVDAEEMQDDALSIGTLVRGLHVLAPGTKETQEIVLFSALVADDEVIETGSASFIAAPVEGEVEGGVTLQDAGVELSSDYRRQRAETPLDGAIFAPANIVGGDDGEISGNTFLPGCMLYPGDTLSPGDLDAGHEEPSMVPAQRFVGGTTDVSGKEPSARVIIEMARSMDARAYEQGEPFLIFFVISPDHDRSRTEAVGLLRLPSRQ